MNKYDQEYVEETERIKQQFGIEETEQFNLHKLYSNYWLKKLPNKNVDMISLASYRRAIANFVKISTLSAGINKPIEVRFNVQDASYTDTDKFVVISAVIKNHEFDAIVGLALHESNHIIDTDSSYTRRLIFTPEELNRLNETVLPLTTLLSNQIIRLKLEEAEVRQCINSIRQWIEDRRIDKRGWERSPGYKPYYDATYKKYFGSKIITLGLKSSYFRELNFESYWFRICNILNPASELDALPGLEKIHDILDIENIGRLKSNADSVRMAMQVLNFIYSHFPESKKKQRGGKKKPEDPEEQQHDDSNIIQQKLDDDMVNIVPPGKDKVKPDLTNKQKAELEQSLAEQKDFIAGNTEKDSVDATQNGLLAAIEESNTTIEKVQGNSETGLDVMVVKKLNRTILESLPISSKNYPSSSLSEDVGSQRGVIKGIALGKVLANKLQIRNETRVYKSKRRTSGKIDKRLLYSVGFGDTSIFEQVKVDKFGDAIVHMSVDASGSMSGREWQNAMTTITAIAYAASVVKNLDVVISFRSTIDIAGQDSDTPLMVIAYDSRKDKFNKIKDLFPFITSAGITPEGLCYEAVMDEIISSVAGKIGYFINFSDGMPNMSNHNNPLPPAEIAQAAVNKMRSVGIKILAFYIGNNEHNLNTFKYMYGKEARNINVTEIVPLAKELNKLFSTQKI